MAAKRPAARKTKATKRKDDATTVAVASSVADALGKLGEFGTLWVRFASSLMPQIEKLQKRIQGNGKLRRDLAKDVMQASVELHQAQREQREHLRNIEDRLSAGVQQVAKALTSKKKR